MKVLDGRNSNKVPKVIELGEFIVSAKYIEDDTCIYSLLLDGFIVPCVSARKNDSYKYCLCGNYKTQRGFDNWLKRQYGRAVKVK